MHHSQLWKSSDIDAIRANVSNVVKELDVLGLDNRGFLGTDIKHVDEGNTGITAADARAKFYTENSEEIADFMAEFPEATKYVAYCVMTGRYAPEQADKHLTELHNQEEKDKKELHMLDTYHVKALKVGRKRWANYMRTKGCNRQQAVNACYEQMTHFQNGEKVFINTPTLSPTFHGKSATIIQANGTDSHYHIEVDDDQKTRINFPMWNVRAHSGSFAQVLKKKKTESETTDEKSTEPES